MEKLSSFWSDSILSSGDAPLIGFTDATDPRILKAALELKNQKIARPVLIGSPDKIEKAQNDASLPKIPPEMIAPELSGPDFDAALKILIDKQKKQTVNGEIVNSQLTDPLYRGIALLLLNKINGLVGGSLRPTADIVKAALQCIGPKIGQRLISGHFLIESDRLKTFDNTPFLFADCAVVPEPSARALAAIAIAAAASYRFFTKQEPKVAILSFSTRDSAVHPLVDRIKEAVSLIRKEEPQLIVDGEIQVDAALDLDIARIKKAGNSAVAGRSNVFVFPTLEAGNIGYKMVQRFSSARIAGPILWGLDKPMSDLSRGCTVQEIIDTSCCVARMIKGSI